LAATAAVASDSLAAASSARRASTGPDAIARAMRLRVVRCTTVKERNNNAPCRDDCCAGALLSPPQLALIRVTEEECA